MVHKLVCSEKYYCFSSTNKLLMRKFLPKVLLIRIILLLEDASMQFCLSFPLLFQCEERGGGGRGGSGCYGNSPGLITPGKGRERGKKWWVVREGITFGVRRETGYSALIVCKVSKEMVCTVKTIIKSSSWKNIFCCVGKLIVYVDKEKNIFW